MGGSGLAAVGECGAQRPITLMSMTAEELVRAHVDAFNAGDLDRLVDGLADDVLWMTYSDVVRGRAAVRDMVGDAKSGLPLSCESPGGI
jgi:ketosteroid isomerase-like protein